MGGILRIEEKKRKMRRVEGGGRMGHREDQGRCK
jgi:hypothetical protein